MASTFKHSGDLGDIIFSLPTVRALGGGVLYLDPEGGKTEPRIQRDLKRKRTRLNAKTIESLKPLLMQQPYISDVRMWTGQQVDYNLDQFRDHLRFQNLSDSHLAAFGLPTSERDRPWLLVDRPIVYPQYPIIISRTLRCAPHSSWWYDAIIDFKDRCAFVGYPKEHEIFEYLVEEKIPYIPTPDLLTLARVIAGAQHFFGNQNAAHAIAEAMKKSVIVEICRIAPAVLFVRPGASYI